jgi:DNA ligase-1
MLTSQRLSALETWFNEIDNGPDHCPANLIMVEQRLVYSEAEILQCEVDFMANGYEGAMALPNIPYYRGKVTNKLMKFKTMLSMDCMVTGIYEGEDKYEGMMGGFSLIQEDGIACKVGSGFSDKDRKDIWNNESLAVGRIAEIKYQEVTPDGVMRFPVFVRWRNDK